MEVVRTDPGGTCTWAKCCPSALQPCSRGVGQRFPPSDLHAMLSPTGILGQALGKSPGRPRTHEGTQGLSACSGPGQAWASESSPKIKFPNPEESWARGLHLKGLKEGNRRRDGHRPADASPGSRSACGGLSTERAAAGAWRPPWWLWTEGLGHCGRCGATLEAQAGAGHVQRGRWEWSWHGDQAGPGTRSHPGAVQCWLCHHGSLGAPSTIPTLQPHLLLLSPSLRAALKALHPSSQAACPPVGLSGQGGC